MIFGRGSFEQPGDHDRKHLDVRDLFGADIEQHVAVLARRAAVPPLEQVLHHDRDLSELPAQHFLQLLRVERVGAFGLCMILQAFVVEKHPRSFHLEVKKGICYRTTRIAQGRRDARSHRRCIARLTQSSDLPQNGAGLNCSQ